MTTPTKKNTPPTSKSTLMLALAMATTGLTLAGVNLAMPGTAHAATTEAMPSEVVRFHDLDLTSESGAATLRLRIRRAARNVCREQETSLIPWPRRRKSCEAATISDAMPRAEWKVAQYRATRLAKN